MTTQPDQDKIIDDAEFYNLMFDFRNADPGESTGPYKAVVAYVDAKLKPTPDQDQMMLRDQFAMAAMQAMLQGSIIGSVKIEGVAEKSYMVADALMEARKPK